MNSFYVLKFAFCLLQKQKAQAAKPVLFKNLSS